MQNKATKVAMVKTWICRNPAGRERLTKSFQSISKDKKEKRKEDGISFQLYKY
jgi:hypothetical protein